MRPPYGPNPDTPSLPHNLKCPELKDPPKKQIIVLVGIFWDAMTEKQGLKGIADTDERVIKMTNCETGIQPNIVCERTNGGAKGLGGLNKIL